MGKPLSVGLLFLVSLALAVVWLWSDLKPASIPWAALKLTIVLAFLTAASAALNRSIWRKISAGLQKLESFAAALPAVEETLPEDGPLELERLSRAMKAMSRRVHNLLDEINLESTRREAILACMAGGVLAVDSGLRVIFCNDAFAQAFGARVPVQQGQTLYELVREPALRDILERVVRSGQPEKDSLQLPTAGSKWFEGRALPLGPGPGRGALIVLHDITAIKHQEQMQKDLVADVSHELRTPLAAIRGYAETLLDGALEDTENNRRFVEIILSHAIRLNNIAADLLVLSELDSKTAPESPPERIPVLDVVNSAVHMVQNAASLRGIRLNRDACRECFVAGYRLRLEQAIVNLLDNAVKFNRNDGEVKIECGRTDRGRVSISISDTGSGIPSGELKRIFERFYRVDKARSRPGGGTGLGLPIVKEVIERMGGTVTVESRLGRGSRFTLELDAAPD